MTTRNRWARSSPRSLAAAWASRRCSLPSWRRSRSRRPAVAQLWRAAKGAVWRRGRRLPHVQGAALRAADLKALTELSRNEDSQAPLTAGAMPTGSLGMAVRLAQSRIKSAEKKAEEEQTAAGKAAEAAKNAAGLVVLCGPSGVGKSTLIARLLQDAPTEYGFSVSCTTRPPRAGEVDGVDYTFLGDDAFSGMIERGEFVEWAQVGGQRYGTSVAGVQAVSAGGKVCLLDLDVQGVQALTASTAGDDLQPYCIWVAPPSLDALRARLRGRGTEDGDEIERRIQRATEEIEVSLTANYFDKIILNDDLEAAYSALRQALDAQAKGRG